MAVFNEPTKWQTSLVNSGDANVIPQSTPVGTGGASFDDGFPQITQVPIGAGGIAPDRKDFNGLFKILGDWIFFAQNGGVPAYSTDFDYVAGRVVLYNGNIYKCIQANGASSTVVAPDSVSPLGSDYWVQVATLADFANFANIDLSNLSASGQALFTAKANTDLSNVPSSKGILVESYHNGASWYRVYSDGWCEQGGLSTQQVVNGSPISITLLKDYLSTSYYIQTGALASSVVPSSLTPIVTCYNLTTSDFSLCNTSNFGVRAFWQACGYIS